METATKNQANATLNSLRMRVIDLQFFLDRKRNFDAIYTIRSLNYQISYCEFAAKICLETLQNSWSQKEILGILANIDEIRKELFENPQNNSYVVATSNIKNQINTILGILGDCNWES